MNKKQTAEAIKALGLSGVWRSEWNEWRVTFTKEEMPSAERREAVAYYTSDNEDALDTAKQLRERYPPRGVELKENTRVTFPDTHHAALLFDIMANVGLFKVTNSERPHERGFLHDNGDVTATIVDGSELMAIYDKLKYFKVG